MSIHSIEAGMPAIDTIPCASEAELREQAAWYRTLFEATSDGLLLIDQDGSVRKANQVACQLFGYSDNELSGLDASRLLHPESHAPFAEALHIVCASGNVERQLRGLRQDGSCCTIELRATPISIGQQLHMLALLRERGAALHGYQLLEQRVIQRNRELATLLEVSHNLASTLELQTLIGLILDRLKLVVDYNAAAIFILEGCEMLRLLKYQGPIPQEDLDLCWSLAEAGHSRQIVQTSEPLIIPDVRASTPMARAFQHKAVLDLGAVPEYISSWMGVPLIHRDQVIGILAVDHSQLGFYTPHHAELALAFANNAAVAIENARLFEQAQGLAALIERQRLARELHDSVSQALYGIALGARTARQLLDIDPTRVADPLDYVLGLADAGMAEMRALIFELRPESLESEGLVMALSKQVAALRARYGIQVVTELCAEPVLPFEIKEALYRIGQEALHNTVRHAQAQRIDLRLAHEHGMIVLDVRDDGIGFDASARFPGHLGLQSMRERIARLHGTIRLESAPGSGTQIVARIPLPGTAR